MAFGDSITDGIGFISGANQRWPDFLAGPLGTSPYGAEAPGVLDEGIGGNRVLNPSACYGPSAVTRFNQDVLDQPGVRAVIVLEGINDIGYSQDADVGCRDAPPPTSARPRSSAATWKMIAMAHAHGIKIIGATSTPLESSWFWMIAGQAKWTAVNHWILTSGAFSMVRRAPTCWGCPVTRTTSTPATTAGTGCTPATPVIRPTADAINLGQLR